MAADQERADRIRQVRQDKHLRWKQIAAYVGVEMRSAQMWQETGAISWDNAVKFAELAGVDAHWLMSGAETNTPSPFSDGSTDERLDRIEAVLATMLERFEDLATNAQAQRSELMDRLETLETAILHNGDVVADRAVDQVRDLVKQPDEVARAIEALAAELHADADQAQAQRASERGRRAASRRPVRAAK